MRIAESKIDEISQKVSIEDVVSQYVSLARKGNRLWGCCPFHNEKTPSFTVTPDKNMYYCFGCHKGGSVFNFLMEVEGLSFIESVKTLAEKVGVDLVFSQNDINRDNSISALTELHNKVGNSFNYLLKNQEEASDAMKYLKNRKITDEIIETFKIGWSPNDSYWLSNFLKKHNYSEDFLNRTGLFSKKNNRYSLHHGRIIFPIFSRSGNIVAFGGRTIVDDGPKYINSPETEVFKKRNMLFALNLAASEIRSQNCFVLCEGYMDVIALHLGGIKNAVAPLGTSFTEEQAFTLKRYTNKGLILFDGDKAGQNATEKALYICEKIGLSVNVCELKENNDPGDILEKDGPQALQNVLKYPISNFEYLLNSALKKHDENIPDGKSSIVESLIPFIKLSDSDVKRDAYFERLSEKLGVDYKAIVGDFFKHKDLSRNNVKVYNDERIKNISIDLFLMLAIIVNRSYFTIVRNSIENSDLKDDLAKELFIALEDSFRHENNSIDFLLGKIETESLKNIILEKMTSEEFSTNTEKIIKDSLKKIKERNLNERSQKITRLIDSFEKNTNDFLQLEELLSEKMFIDDELEKLRIIGND